jgi:hypothetical protein
VSHPEPAWKQQERAVARYWGTERTPLSGSNSRHATHSDTLHPTVYIEFKHGRSCPTTWRGIRRLFEDVEHKAMLEHKRAILVLHPKRLPRVEEWPTYLRVAVIPTWSMDHIPVGAVVCVPQSTARAIVLNVPDNGPAACPAPDPRQKTLSV